MRLTRLLTRVVLLIATLATVRGAAAQPAQVPVPSSGPPSAPSPASDLDTLMARVLTNRDQSWRRLQEYLLAERETFRLIGPDGGAMFGMDKEFLWVAREGRAVRSPVRVNGVAVGEAKRREAEADWQKDDDARAAKAAERAGSQKATAADVEAAMRSGEPRFISEVQFLRFKFEPGNYYFVGRETLAGREVLRVEYYPRRLFADDDGRHTGTAAKGAGEAKPASDDYDARIEQAMNKVSLVTLWVDPTVDQIVRYTFDNVDFNFLPGRSLVRLDTATATMTMGQPFAGVWLPDSLTVEGALTLATGSYRAEYARRFRDYRQADVQVRFRVKDDDK
jgi:hypothetical protein